VAGDLSTAVAYVIPAEISHAHIEQVLGGRLSFPEPGRKFFEYLTHQMLPVLGDQEEPKYSSSAGRDDNEEKRKSSDVPPLPREWGGDVQMTGTGNLQEEEKNSDLTGTETEKAPEKAQIAASRDSDTSSDIPRASIPSNMATGGLEARIRDRDRHRSAAGMSSRSNEYFVPRHGIDREVITADICRYLGNDALVRPGTYEVCITFLGRLIKY
jgi:hypothetical protein